jgi:hypothetical protein
VTGREGPLSEQEENQLRRQELAPLVAAITMSCPAIHDADDLRVGIRYADTHPQARPFVIKAAAQLGLLDRLPGWEEVADTTVHLDQHALRITASGQLVDVASGQPFTPRPPARSQRRQRPVRDRADLRSAIDRAPTDPATRQALVEAAQRLDRLRWIPSGWPAPAVQLAPGAAQALQRAARPGQLPTTELRDQQRRSAHGGRS